MKNYLQFILFKRVKSSRDDTPLHSLCIFLEHILLFFRTSTWYDCTIYKIEIECMNSEGIKEVITINMNEVVSHIPKEEMRKFINNFIKFLDGHYLEVKGAEAIKVYIRAYPK
jgi:hypothetical protein